MERRAFLRAAGAGVFDWAGSGRTARAEANPALDSDAPPDLDMDFAREVEESDAFELIGEAEVVDWLVLHVAGAPPNIWMELIDNDVWPDETVEVPINRGAYGPTISVVGEVPYTLNADWEKEGGRLEPHVWFVEPARVRVFQTRRSHR